MSNTELLDHGMRKAVWTKFRNTYGFTVEDVAEECGLSRHEARSAINSLITSRRFLRLAPGKYRAVGALP